MKHNQKRNDIIHLDGNSYADAMQQRIEALKTSGTTADHLKPVDIGAHVEKQLAPIQQRFLDRGGERKSTGKLATEAEMKDILERHEKRIGG